MEAGLDSLGATEFRNQLSQRLSIALPDTLVFDFAPSYNFHLDGCAFDAELRVTHRAVRVSRRLLSWGGAGARDGAACARAGVPRRLALG